MTMTIREAFEKATEAFNAHDIGEFTSLLADDVVFHAPGGVSTEGKDACAQYFAGWLNGFSDAHVEVHAVHITGDVAVEEGTFTGTHDGVLRTPAGDIPPTGRRVAGDYIEVHRFRDGKSVYSNLMYDQLELLGQLGLAPAPAAAG
jgi:ketosteroid isomerase-like protein